MEKGHVIIKEHIKQSKGLLNTKKKNCLTLRNMICWSERTWYVCMHTLVEDENKGGRLKVS